MSKESSKITGGRPKGSSDKKPRKRRGKVTSDKKAKSIKPGKRFLLDQLDKYNYDIVQEILWLLDHLKSQAAPVHDPETGIEVLVFPRGVVNQIIDIQKALLSHAYPKLKALELGSTFDKPITLNLNLGGGPEPKQIEKIDVQKKEEAIDLVQGPAGIHLPVLKSNSDYHEKLRKAKEKISETD